MKWIRGFMKRIWQLNILGCVCIMLVVLFVMSMQLTNRTQFANTELYQDVMDRWGQPITQAAPSVRFVKTGSVFTSLKKLSLTSQTITMDADMNYRKRGLVYFSGFDFRFKGEYSVVNTEGTDIDIVFIFPFNLEKNRVLLKNFTFNVNNKPALINRSKELDKLVWTGRLKNAEKVSFAIEYAGRGLDKFVYLLDPSLQVKNFSMVSKITGGDNYD